MLVAPEKFLEQSQAAAASGHLTAMERYEVNGSVNAYSIGTRPTCNA